VAGPQRLRRYVPNEGPAWQFTLDELSRFFERVLALPHQPKRQRGDTLPHVPLVPGSALDVAEREAPHAARELIDNYLDSALLLGQRTAEMHLALAAETEQADFAPEPFSTLYQRSIYQSLRNLKRRAFEQLTQQLDACRRPARAEGRRLLDADEALHQRLRAVLAKKIHAVRTRHHGDYHLGHVLYTGKDFVIIDFEGEADRSITERRLKRSPLVRRGEQWCVRSITPRTRRCSARRRPWPSPGLIRPEDVPVLEPWARFWYGWVSATFLKAYLRGTEGTALLPRDPAELRVPVRRAVV